MRFKTGMLIGFCFLFSGFALANVSTKALQSHVTFLSSDALEGRLTGTLGEQRATQYVAQVYHSLGLTPAGDNGTFFQVFDFTAGVLLGKNNTLSITNQRGITQHLQLNHDWRPLSFSDSLTFENNNLIFAGYGITAPAEGKLLAYNSYHDLNVKNKWVVVFRYMPEHVSEAQRRQLTPYASPRYKAFTARNQGAKGIIFISGPNAQVLDQLLPLSFDASLAGSGIAALSVTDKIISHLIKSTSTSHTLKQYQNQLDKGQTCTAPIFSDIKITGSIDIKQKKQQGRNVLAKLQVNTKPSAQMIIIGAHVDHLGHGELSGSRAQSHEKGFIHHGADDNASGVASVLETAQTLSHWKTSGKLRGNQDILFAIWSGEELGLLGSTHFVKNLSKHTTNKLLHSAINANINLDMVGRLEKNLIIQGVGSSTLWPNLIKHAQKKYPIALITQNDPYLPTDSSSFYLQGVPAINFFTGAHNEYHTPQDKSDTLNYNGMKHISLFLAQLILMLEEKSKVISYQHVPKTGNTSREGFKVYFGTIPDYASSDVVGVKLSGVTKNSPAERAGIQPNDVIIELAGKTIHDLYDYTFVLRALSVGKPVTLVVLRERVAVKLTIVAQSRE